MNRLFFIVISILVIFLDVSPAVFTAGKTSERGALKVVHPVAGRDCELKERINRAIRELPLVEQIKQSHHHRSQIKPIHSKRSVPHKRKSRQAISQLAKNLESFLQRVIPNHNLVQDLMGYVTMPNPNRNRNINRHY